MRNTTGTRRQITGWTSALIALFSMAACPTSVGEVQKPPTAKRILIDPLFGGAETGPMIAPDWPAKRLTWAFALALRDAAQERGATALMSRDADIAKSEVDRWILTGRLNVKWHIVFSANRGKTNCVRLYIPTEEQGWKPTDSNEFGKKLFVQANRHISIRSGVVAARIEETLRKAGTCASVAKSHQPLLDIARVPTIVIELENATVTQQDRPFLGEAFRKELAQAVARILVEISETDFPTNARLPD